MTCEVCGKAIVRSHTTGAKPRVFCSRACYKKSDKLRFPMRYRDAHLKRTFGITHDTYLKILEEQGGCAICGTYESGSSRTEYLMIDHSHATRKIRGVLCHRCNYGISLFSDSPTLLRRAIRYLSKK